MVLWKFCGECRSLVVRPWYDRSFGFAESDDEMKRSDRARLQPLTASFLAFSERSREIRKRGIPLAKKKKKKKTEILDF